MSAAQASPILTLLGDPGADFITDMQYDYYGRRLATTSADGVVRVRDVAENGEWSVQEGCELKVTHAGTVWKVVWAHPDFGQLLATCSQDRTVKIWEEHSEAAAGDERNGLPRGSPRWLCVASLSESRYGVCDVKFAPRHLGLRIAAASEDGSARFYRATDPSYVGAWHQEASFNPCGAYSAVKCVSWCQSPFEKPLIVVGTMSGLVQIWSIDGNTEDFRDWVKVLDLPRHDSRAVSCVDWAAQMGRSFHRIATCGADGQLQVHTVISPGQAEGGEWRHVHTHQLQDGKQGDSGGSAWQAHWNMTGTSLITAEGSAVRIWGTEHDGSWSCLDTLHEACVDRMVPPAGEVPATAVSAATAPSAAAIEEG